ncbi:hypothetical protein [Liquorilactobacillus oeni]|uniref:Bifunctional glutamate--cysteine ligase glutathione synthetase n=1 Tax=Liquorilactobacillus oeni DSM 19972 TaxID=1423777 RepID=A0A0R1M788_9LACO|nr:hypothetical protein [Liquorilactobacillus oeni]KRL04189.1 hypothetical protein FD46_GL001308 [Liquorilactobacillus oeni DSM 19972]
MQYDEIGNEIITEGLMNAFSALRWKIEQIRKVDVSEENQKARKITVENSSYFAFSAQESSVTLKTHPSLSKEKVLIECKLLLSLLQSSLETENKVQTISQKGDQSGTALYWRLPERLFVTLYEKKFKKTKIDYLTFRNQLYLKVLQQFAAHQWFLTYLTSAVPFSEASSQSESPQRSTIHSENSKNFNCLKKINYKTSAAYFKSVICDDSAQEGVFVVRDENKDQLLKKENVAYFKINRIELSPFEKIGFKEELLDLLSVMTAYFMSIPGIATENMVEYLHDSRKLDAEVADENPFAQSCCYKRAKKFMADLLYFVQDNNLFELLSGIEKFKKIIDDPLKTPAAQILRSGKQPQNFFIQGQENFIVGEEKQQLLDADSYFLLKAAFKNGVKFEVVSADKQLLKVGKTLVLNGIEDMRTSSLYAKIWHNRLLCKDLVQANGFGVPSVWGIVKNTSQIRAAHKLFKDASIILKGEQNFGVVSFRNTSTKKDFYQAVRGFLKVKQKCVIEQYLNGTSYRILIARGEPISILERCAQNIVGDGHSTIAELVTRKKKKFASLQRSFPFEELQKRNISVQGRTMTTVLARGKQLFLRFDTEVGSGTEYLECISEMQSSYVREIKRLAQVLKMQNGALDVIISNLYQPLEEAKKTKQFIFLNAHEYPNLTIHEHTLMNGDMDVATKLLTALLKK